MPRTDPGSPAGRADPRILATAPGAPGRSTRPVPRTPEPRPGDAPAGPLAAGRAGTPATRRSCRRTGSIARPLALVVVAVVPLELAHEFEQAALFAAGDEFLERLRHGRLLRSFS